MSSIEEQMKAAAANADSDDEDEDNEVKPLGRTSR